MGALAAGSVVLVPFPFSDLSQSKLRPAVVLAEVGRGDWILCQVTSNRYSDTIAVELTSHDFDAGSRRVGSYARPGKIFTANEKLFTSNVGRLSLDALRRVISALTTLLDSGIPT